jgi:hypothetical protein
MKKLFFILLTVSFFIFLSSIFINSAIIFLAKRQLNTIFKGSEVTIGSCRLNPVKQLSLFEISIKNKQAYDFLIKEARAEYSLFSIFKSKILKFSLKDAKIYINLPQKSITAFSQYLNLDPKGVFLVKSLELSTFNLDLKAKDFNISGVLFSQVNLIEKIMDYLDIKIDSLGIQGLNLSNISFKAAQGSSEGCFGISQIKYNKLNISEIKSQVMLSGKELFLENVYAKAFDGNIGGNLKFKIDQDFSYDAVLRITNLDIARFINDFDLKEKFEMTGRLIGDLAFKGKGSYIEILNGKLSSLESGGMLIIKDTKFLENMARDTNQSLDLLVENFKDYHYNIGTIKLFLDNSNLILDIVLDGETGKRNINIVLHDSRLKKEGI